MIRVSFSVLFLMFFVGTSFPAFAALDRCPRQQVKTELVAKRAKTRYQRGDIFDINSYLGNHSRESGTVLAFVQWGGPDVLSIQPFYKFGVFDAGAGKFCVMLDRVKVNFYAAPILVMPSNYSRKSCEYQLILKHEKRHLSALYDFHDKNTGKYQAYLGRIARDVPVSPLVTSEAEAEEVRNMIMEYFAHNFYEQVQKSIDEVSAIQQKIDSPQEYLGVGKKLQRCDIVRNEGQNKKTFHRSD